MRFLTCLVHEHDLRLVAMAALFCLFGSAVTVGLLRQIRSARANARVAWVFMGGLSTGATIWCTHFIAMIAYQPGVPVTYEPRVTGLSLLVAITGSAAALALGARPSRPAAIAAGALFGLTVTAMHYTGMSAFVARGLVSWSPGYVAASIAGAVLLGGAAFDRARGAEEYGAASCVAIGLLMSSIVVLHFTGMAALAIVPVAPGPGQYGEGTATLVMVFAVAGVGALVLGTGLATYALDAQARVETRRRLDELLEGSVDGMVVEQDGTVVAANAAFVRLVGMAPAAVAGERLDRWLPGIVGAAAGALSQMELAAADGGAVPVEVATRVDRGGAREQTVRAIRDLRARLAQERRIVHLACNDGLTGLPNRTAFLERLARQTEAQAGDAGFALLSIDLDRFKEVNDVHGHTAGDGLLARIGERVAAALRPGEFAARLGGDEFVALVPVAVADETLDGPLDLIDRLRDAVTAPVMLEGVELACGISIGVALWPRDATEASALINNADLAMYRAKGSIATDICFYEEEMDTAVRTRRRMAGELRRALADGELSLAWQVQESVETGRVTGYEALLRWHRPDGTSVPPSDFIPVAEQTGLILPIGEWVLRTACREAAGWETPHKIAVNLSPVQLGHVDLPRLVHDVLVEAGLPSSRLELEITETAMITDPLRTAHILRQLKGLGVSVAMDDFGTGYSSLSTLRSFPFDKIKLDRSFMTELDGGPQFGTSKSGAAQSAAIIRAVLALGRSLAIPVLAEGVEHESQLVFLRQEGCDEAQGYLLGLPGPVEARTARAA